MPWSFRQLLVPLSAILLSLSACGDDDDAVCGNNVVEAGEQCDDGNTTNGDGCESTCRPTPTPGTDAGSDAGSVTDAGTDAGSEEDAGADAGSDTDAGS
ncbi:hypothetical protein ACLESO_33295, partial [Pyxidicoccus sp. 3LG]